MPDKKRDKNVVTTYPNDLFSDMIQALSLSPVLDLQQIADETVASTALNKVTLSGKEFLCIVVPMLLPEVVEQ